LFTYASADEHGRHYRSCATEWGWREDENRPPYKRPKAIVRANAKTQLDYQPTFHTERKPAAGIILRGTTRGDQDEPGSHTTTTLKQLQGLGAQKGNYSRMPPRMSMADITAHALSSGDGEKTKISHPTNDPRPSFGQTRKTQLDYQPTFHTERKTVAGIIWRGPRGRGTKTSQGGTPQQPVHNSKNLESRRVIVHICLPGQAWPTLPLMRYRVGMERR